MADCEADLNDGLTCEDCLEYWTDVDLRLEALKLAVESARQYPPDMVVALAADFYNFLNGETMTSNIEKLDKIADILADE